MLTNPITKKQKTASCWAGRFFFFLHTPWYSSVVLVRGIGQGGSRVPDSSTGPVGQVRDGSAKGSNPGLLYPIRIRYPLTRSSYLILGSAVQGASLRGRPTPHATLAQELWKEKYIKLLFETDKGPMIENEGTYRSGKGGEEPVM